VGEEISKISDVRIVCNSELDMVDFKIATGRNTAIKERWNRVDVEAEALLQKERYKKLDQLFQAGNVQIRVVPREVLFLHGKAGVVYYPDGRRTSFIGSVNESKSAFSRNYELIWQDDDEQSADWVEEEFHALWEDGDSADRVEHILSDMSPAESACLQEIETQLSRPEAVDSKLNSV